MMSFPLRLALLVLLPAILANGCSPSEPSSPGALTLAIASPPSVYVGTMTVFTARVTSRPAATHMRWSFGDNTFDEVSDFDSTAAHIYAAAGAFTVTADLVQNGTNMVLRSATITVQAVVNPYHLRLESPARGPIDSTITFLPNPTAMPQSGSLRWDFGDGTVPLTSPNAAPVTHRFGASGRFLVRVAMLDGTGLPVARDSAAIIISEHAVNGIELVRVPAFTVRDQNGTALTRRLLVGIHEVTQGEWASVTGENPSRFVGDDRRPVENITMSDAIRFCNTLSEREGLSLVYSMADGDGVWHIDVAASGYRLLMHKEFEVLCRAGATGHFYTGGITIGNGSQCLPIEPALDRAGWYCGNSGNTTHPVTMKLPNAYGLYDMHGNVGEWCASTGTPASTWVASYICGGAWDDTPNHCTADSYTDPVPPANRGSYGLRIARKY